MAINYPGPYQVRLFYQTIAGGDLTEQHVLQLNVDVDTAADPGDPFDEWVLKSRLGAAPQLDTWVDDLVAVLVPHFKTTSSISRAELWKYTAGSFNAAFQSSYTIGEAGTSTDGVLYDREDIYTFRSTNGGLAKLYLERPIGNIQVTAQFPTGTAIINNLANFITANASPVIARDNGYLFQALNFLAGYNEASFKNRLRP